MNPIKLQLLVELEDGGVGLKDLFINIGSIDGFYIPEIEADFGEPTILIYLNGVDLMVKTEDHIKDFLYEKFVKPTLKKQ